MLRDERSARSAEAFAAEALLRWHQGRYTPAREAALHGDRDRARVPGAQGAGIGADDPRRRYTRTWGRRTMPRSRSSKRQGSWTGSTTRKLRARTTRSGAWTRYLHGRFEESLALSRVGLEVARREGSDGRYGVNLLDGVFEDLIELGRWSEAEVAGDQILARMTQSLEMLGVAHVAGAAVHASGSHRRGRTRDRPGRGDRRGRPPSGLAARGRHLPRVRGRPLCGWPELRWKRRSRRRPNPTVTRSCGGRFARRSVVRPIAQMPPAAVVGSLEVEEAVAAGRRFAGVLRRSARDAIEADGGGPMIRAELSTADAEESRLEGRPDPARWGPRSRRGASSSSRGSWRTRGTAMRRPCSRPELRRSTRRSRCARRTRWRTTWARRRSASSIEALASRARIQLESQPSSGGPGATPATTLTARELEVLALVAAGHTNREIGERLFISEKTASVHVTHAMDKLGALSRYEAAATATRLGLLEPPVVP